MRRNYYNKYRIIQISKKVRSTGIFVGMQPAGINQSAAHRNIESFIAVLCTWLIMYRVAVQVRIGTLSLIGKIKWDGVLIGSPNLHQLIPDRIRQQPYRAFAVGLG